MSSFLQNILLGNHYIGLEFFSQDNKEKVAFLLLQKKKNEITISKKDIFTKRDSLFAEKSKYPAVLTVNNEQILQKEIMGIDSNDKKLLHKAFPNLQADDFYYEIWRRDTTSVVAICRKSYIDELIAPIQNNFQIVSITFGITSLSGLMGFGLPETITTNTQALNLNGENAIENIGTTALTDYDINGLTVPNTHLLSFSAALRILVPDTTTGSVVLNNEAMLESFRQKAFFDKGFRVAIIFILTLLLVNFFLFTYYFDNVASITQTVSVNKSGIENIAKIKTRINDKEKRLGQVTGRLGSGSSYLLNEIARLLPASISLTEMVYNPMEKKIKDDEKIQLTGKLITISGNSLSNTAFTNWIENVEKLSGVESVTISSFGKDTENKTAFSIVLQLK